MQSLTSLAAWSVSISDESIKAMASLQGLTSLTLSNNNIGDKGARTIASSLHGLTSLSLTDNRISDEGARAIAASLQGLTSLSLNHNNIGDEGARAIAASLHDLTSFSLNNNNVGNEGTRAIAASLHGLTSLNLSHNNIGDEGARAIAASLHGLTSLTLSDNYIGDEGAKAILASLLSLTSLNLSHNSIGNDGVTAIAATLHSLTTLSLNNNSISDKGARAIAASLHSLASLSLSNNNVGDEGARAIAASLHGLTALSLSNNNIGNDGATAIAASLRGLTSLVLNSNSIGNDGATAIAASLHGLTSLTLSNNNIDNHGARAIAASLRNLISLSLGSNSIDDEGARAVAASLPRLTSLNLSHNSIGDNGATSIAASLRGLNSLNLSRNRIGGDGAKSIAAWMHGLNSLNLSNNNIDTEGAEALLRALSSNQNGSQLYFLALRDNRDLSDLLPREVLETTDAQSILAAYRRFVQGRDKQTLRPLSELKFIVVGNEAVGKTSLLRYLISGMPRNPSEVKTPGIVQHEKIEIQTWSPDRCQVQLNVWDFGGQEMMRGTHRFFLTDRSLYLLVLEDRRQDDRSIYDWMKTIRNRAGNSPVIVTINKSDAGKQDLRLDETGILQTYPNVSSFLRTSCDPGDWARSSIEALRRNIVEIIAMDERLKHVQDPIPANWFQIKNRVSDLASERSVLSYSDFVALCKDPGNVTDPIIDENEQRALLRLLHELGTIVAHGLERDAPAALREISLLDPNWLTGAIYRIMDRASSVDQEGEFLRHQLIDWLDPKLYPQERHEFILDMMQDPEVGLCFRRPALKEERYLLPEALPASRRFYGKWPEDSLRFRYVYNYLPPGLIPRFIVQSHQNLTPENSRWRTGVVLCVRGCDALVLADVDKRRVDIEVAGSPPLRRAALNVVLNDLEAVHALNPEADPVAVVPLPDHSEVHVSYEHLLVLEKRLGPKHEFIPDGTNRAYHVDELLEGVRRDESKQVSVSEKSAQQTKPHVVILVHGIRTRALWQNELRKLLEANGFKVEPTNYGYFDILRFLFPWQLFAGRVVDDITRQIRHSREMNKEADCSIIAHSFGTFVVSRILRGHTDLEFNRIIFCGSVVPHQFRFEDYRKRFQAPLVNEVGTRDFWPVFAEVVTFGFGSAGTYGFRRPAVRDRWHNGKAHSDFFNREFYSQFWVPFLRDGKIVEDDEQAEPPPRWLWAVSTFQARYAVLIAVGALLWRWLWPYTG